MTYTTITMGIPEGLEGKRLALVDNLTCNTGGLL